MKKIKVVVNDQMQKKYVYFLIRPEGRNFDPNFRPQLTPKEMLRLGVFGGKYMTDCRNEFPVDWFKFAKLSFAERDPKLNYYGVNASQPLSVWRKKGWIYEEDPRGWFQWYCRYYRGRRSVDDERQISRWKAIRRHIAQLKKNCPRGVLTCRRRQRQALLHWAYDSRKFNPEFDQVFTKVPRLYSSNAVFNSAWVFITTGPYQAMGSFSGFPEINRNRTDLWFV